MIKTTGIFLTALAVLAACAVREAPKPAEEIPSAKIHKCDMCHVPHQKETGATVLLNKPINELCRSCHEQRADSGEHVVGINPSMIVTDLPLDPEGKIYCLTCHDPHGAKGYNMLLRAADFNQLCLKCHKEY